MWLTNASYLAMDGTLRHGDIAVEDGLITEIAPHRPGRSEAVECARHLLVPGLVNAHFHSQSTLLDGLDLGMSVEQWGSGGSAAGRVQERLFSWLDDQADAGELAALVRKEYLDQLRQGVTYVADSGVSERDGVGPLLADVQEEVGLRGTVELYDRWQTPQRPDRQQYSVHLPEEEDLDEKTLAQVAGVLADGEQDAGPHPTRTTHSLETPHRRQSSLAYWGRSSIQVLAEHGLLDERTVLFHGCLADATDLAAVADAGAALIHCPVSNLTTGGRSADTGAWLEAGVTTGIGTDWATTDLWQAARAARLVLAAQQLRGQDIPARVLWAATRGGALAYRRHDLGEIAAGRAADLVLLDIDALTPLLDTADVSTVAHAVLARGGSRAVRHVMVAGRWVLRASEPVRVDGPDVDRGYRALVSERLAAAVSDGP